MAKRDYYEVLGVSKNATDQEIKSSFRKLSRKYHPDMQAGKTDSEKKESEDKFKEIAEAYEVLSNKEKRQSYDQFGFDGPNMNSHSFGGGAFDMADFMSRHGGMFGSMFGSMFGGDDEGFSFRGMHTRKQKPNFNFPENGNNVQANIKLTFKESINGCKKTFKMKLTEECSDCKGTGIDSKVEPTECPHCHGSGMIVKTVRQGFMISQTTMPCPHCSGGYIVKPCKKCNGRKRLDVQKNIEVEIPANLYNGETLRMRGAGHCGVKGGNAGDLFLHIKTEHQDIFEKVEGSRCDLTTKIYVDPITAILGGTVEIQTPYEKAKLEIPSGIQFGTVLISKGNGIKTKNEIGNLRCIIYIETPNKLTEKQKEEFLKLKEQITIENLPLTKNNNKSIELLLK
jgi:molecular chaperone DnaJ